MYVFSSFEYSTHLELAISDIERIGIGINCILAVPLNKKIYRGKLLDRINYSDGISSFDTATIFCTFFMILGVIYGYILRWGPIIWGLIGMVSGFFIGFLIDLIPKRRLKINKQINKKPVDVILVINCDTSQTDAVERILFNNFAIGVGKYSGS